MARCKNAGSGPGDEDPWPPPRLTAQEKGKVKKTTMKKQKFIDVETERAAAVQPSQSERREVDLGVAFA